MTTEHRAIQREAIRQQLIRLAEQFEAAVRQSGTAIDGRAEKQAEQEAQEIAKKIEDWEAALERLELAPSHSHDGCDSGRDPKRVHDILRAHIHEIDYGHIDAWLRRFLDVHCDAGQAALLMFRRAIEMNGALCAARIREILSAHTDTGLFHYRRVMLQPGLADDTASLLRRLGGEFGVTIDDRTPGQQLRLVTRRLCDSLLPGGILFLEIGGCDCLTYQDPCCFHWVVSDFWRQLLEDLKPVAAELDGNLTVVAITFFDGDPPDGALPAGHCCSVDDFHRERLLEIPLRHWTAHEVRDWLNRRGLPGHRPAVQKAVADLIMKVTGGIPDRTENELLKRCAAP